MTYPLVLDLAAGGVPVAVTCRVLGISKQAFYQWRAGPVPQRDWDDAHLINAAREVRRDDRLSGTGSSLMSCPPAGSAPGRTGSPGSAPSSASGRHSRGSAA